MTVPEQAEWLLVKRGLYYRPNDCGYTGIRDEAGRYSETDAYSRASNGVTMIRADLAPEFSEKCYPDLALKHVIKQRDDLRAQPLMGVQPTDVARADTWLIRKNGYFYRPNSRGYTASIYEAGLYSQKDAEQEARIEPGITAHPISEYRQLAEVDLAQARRVIALIDDFAPKPAGQPVEGEVTEWFKLHDAYHKASAAYNARLAIVRAERERGNWSMSVDAEYRVLSDAQREAIGAAETLYQALSPAPASPHEVHERETQVDSAGRE